MKSRGFTLLEVLVSLAILATSVAAITMLFSGGLRSIRASEENLDLALIAASEMRALLAEEVLEEGEEYIQRDGYEVRRTVEEVEVEKTEGLPLRLFRINLTISAGGKVFTLVTEKTVQRRLYETP